jgi:uncharacterized membrane protein
MGWTKREHMWRRFAILVASLAVIVFVSVVALGSPGGILFAIAIGTAAAVAIFSDTRGTCSPRLFRRRGDRSPHAGRRSG